MLCKLHKEMPTLKKNKTQKKKEKKGVYHRSYLTKDHLTAKKIVKIKEIYRPFRIAEAQIAKKQWRLLQQGNLSFSKNRDDLPASPLSQRYLREAEYNVVPTLNSFLSNRVNDFRSLVLNSSLEENLKHQLLMINSWQAWYYRAPQDIRELSYLPLENHKALIQQRFLKREAKRKETAETQGKNFLPTLRPTPPYLTFPKETFTLARKLMRQLLYWHQKPQFNSSNMRLTANVARIERKLEPTLSRNHLNRGQPCSGCLKCQPATNFEFWATFSTLEAREPIYLPIQDSKYRQKKGGKLSQILQINFTNLGETQLTLVNQKPLFKSLSAEEQEKILEEAFETSALEGSISLDTGLSVLLATDQGDLHGLNFMDKLVEYDKRLQPLVSHLNRQKIRLRSCPKYLRLIQDIRGYIKNEINRNLNRIVSLHTPARIIIDKLDFRDSHLSKRMNRILRNCGLSILKNKLTSLEEEYGIEIIYVNPAFTSVECNHCGYIDKRNRRGRKFKCLLCGYTLHSDVGGARNHKARSSRIYPRPITSDTRVKDVLEILVQNFLVQLKSLPCLSRLHSKAKVLILSNPYFKDYWDQWPKGFGRIIF